MLGRWIRKLACNGAEGRATSSKGRRELLKPRVQRMNAFSKTGSSGEDGRVMRVMEVMMKMVQ
jgi:hypothetical protein